MSDDQKLQLCAAKIEQLQHELADNKQQNKVLKDKCCQYEEQICELKMRVDEMLAMKHEMSQEIKQLKQEIVNLSSGGAGAHP